MLITMPHLSTLVLLNWFGDSFCDDWSLKITSLVADAVMHGKQNKAYLAPGMRQ